jgi:acyl-CoA hydrolase
MKKIFLSVAMLISSYSAHSAEVIDARTNLETMEIEVEVAYAGGCEEHVFGLQLGMCFESYPVQCTAKLLHTTKSGEPDFCEAFFRHTVKFPLEDYGFLSSYFKNGSLTISGAGESSATVKLP